MYELISIPKRNTTAAGVTHFMFKFLVLISHLGPATSKADWLAWQGRATIATVRAGRHPGPAWILESDLMIFMIRGSRRGRYGSMPAMDDIRQRGGVR
jgi:hypothetical protein